MLFALAFFMQCVKRTLRFLGVQLSRSHASVRTSSCCANKTTRLGRKFKKLSLNLNEAICMTFYNAFSPAFILFMQFTEKSFFSKIHCKRWSHKHRPITLWIGWTYNVQPIKIISIKINWEMMSWASIIKVTGRSIFSLLTDQRTKIFCCFTI
jgi:hypothetical protein